MTVRDGTVSLLPCPFCGGEAKLWVGLSEFEDGEVQCPCGGAAGNHPNAAEAIAAWNLRAVPSEDSELRARKVVADYYRRGGNHSMADEILTDGWRSGASQSELDLVASISEALPHPARRSVPSEPVAVTDEDIERVHSCVRGGSHPWFTHEGNGEQICQICGSHRSWLVKEVLATNPPSPASKPEVTEAMRDLLTDCIVPSYEFDAESGGYYDTELTTRIRDALSALKAIEVSP